MTGEHQKFSLVRFGMDMDDEEDLVWFFDRMSKEPAELGDRLRWNRVHRIVADRWGLNEVGDDLVNYYQTGMMRWAFHSKAASAAYAEAHPTVAMPQHGGPEFVEWVSKETRRTTFNAWLAALHVRVAHDAVDGKDRLLLDQIRHEVSPALEALVKRYQGRKGFVERELRREEKAEEERKRQALEEERRLRGDGTTAPQRKSRGRRYGELPAEPEVIIKRRG